MHSLVGRQLRALPKACMALSALVRPFSSVQVHVLAQVLARGQGLLTDVALVLMLLRMHRVNMPLHVLLSGVAFLAVFERANERCYIHYFELVALTAVVGMQTGFP